MTDKVTLGSFSSFQNDTTAVALANSNNALITTAIDNTLSRDGTGPNQMGAALDMNSNQIINLPAPSTQNSPARLIDVVSNPTIVVPGTGTSGHVVPFLDGNNTWSGTNSFAAVTFSLATTFGGSATFSSLVSLPLNTTLANRSIVTFDTNQNVYGGTGALTSLTSGIYNVAIGQNAGHNLTSGTENIIIGGSSGGTSLTTGSQNTIIGSEAGSNCIYDTGHTLVGWQAGLSLQATVGLPTTWNTFIGHAAGNQATTAGGCIAIGRAAGHGLLADSDTIAIGHAACFYGTGVPATNQSTQSTVVGAQGMGAPVDGTGTNWQGSGQTYYGLGNDVNGTYIGSNTGKSSSLTRTNCFALGNLARVPIQDNMGVLGHTMTGVSTSGNFFSGLAFTTVSSGASTSFTLTEPALVNGSVQRTGSAAGAITDTTDTAVNLVAKGPGTNSESNTGRIVCYQNTSGQTITIVGGTNVAISGSASMTNGVNAIFLLQYLNCTAGSESVVLRRIV